MFDKYKRFYAYFCKMNRIPKIAKYSYGICSIGASFANCELLYRRMEPYLQDIDESGKIGSVIGMGTLGILSAAAFPVTTPLLYMLDKK